MIAIDLFCGRGGWTNALLEQGFTVYGFDINPQPEYKGIFIQADILAMTADDLRAYKPVFATCSSPCEQFSIHGMKHFHPNPPYPEMGIRLFNHSRALLEELGIRYVMENVKSARAFVGKSVHHCAAFHLWGNAVPHTFPKAAYKVVKGVEMGSGGVMKAMTKEQKHAYRKQFPMMQVGGKSKARAEFTARAAMIPEVIARAVAEEAAFPGISKKQGELFVLETKAKA